VPVPPNLGPTRQSFAVLLERVEELAPRTGADARVLRTLQRLAAAATDAVASERPAACVVLVRHAVAV
jgi:hypothetical protein